MPPLSTVSSAPSSRHARKLRGQHVYHLRAEMELLFHGDVLPGDDLWVPRSVIQHPLVFAESEPVTLDLVINSQATRLRSESSAVEPRHEVGPRMVILDFVWDLAILMVRLNEHREVLHRFPRKLVASRCATNVCGPRVFILVVAAKIPLIVHASVLAWKFSMSLQLVQLLEDFPHLVSQLPEEGYISLWIQDIKQRRQHTNPAVHHRS
mmetsp:Transcript_32304/g.89228  ORF Transcript_32304/g.89228 Transcript_32304/m.89228 type:complete len:209 (-) Transcript_32304:1710-2336(-)